MKKSGIVKLFACMLGLAMIFGCVNISAQAAAPQPAKKIVKSDKKQQKIRQYFGKQGVSGNDYSGESTAGVGGANKQGLKANQQNKNDKVKEDLYQNSPDKVDKAIDSSVDKK